MAPATGEFCARIAAHAERGVFDALFLNDQPTPYPGWKTSAAPLRLDSIVVPLLQKQGIHRHKYIGGTLRSHLGPPSPQW